MGFEIGIFSAMYYPEATSIPTKMLLTNRKTQKGMSQGIRNEANIDMRNMKPFNDYYREALI